MPEPAPVTRLTLLPVVPPARALPGRVRRYRLAAVRPGVAPDAGDRFAHLKRGHD